VPVEAADLDSVSLCDVEVDTVKVAVEAQLVTTE
jgi:hypothetical protein